MSTSIGLTKNSLISSHSPFGNAPGEILHLIFLECILAEFLPVEGGIAQEDPYDLEESDDHSSTTTTESSDWTLGSGLDEITQEELDALDQGDEPLPPGYPSRSELESTSVPRAVSPSMVARLEFAYVRAPWLLCQICHWWRQILMTSSDLWRFIDIDVDDYMFGRYVSSKSLLAYHLALSGHQTLHIRFSSCFTSDRCHQLFKLLYEHHTRWETVELYAPDSTLISMLEYVDMVVPGTMRFETAQVSQSLTSFPSLTSLVAFNYGENPVAQSRVPVFHLFARSPNIRHFSSMRPIPMNALSVQWEHLLSLSLYLFSPLLALSFLRQLTALQECSFEILGISRPLPAQEIPSGSVQAIYLPALLVFTLRLNRNIHEGVIIFLDSIDAPNLETFCYHISSQRRFFPADVIAQGPLEAELTNKWGYETSIYRFLEKCGRNLRNLFIDCKLPIDQHSQYLTHQDIFRMAPQLEHATFASQALNFISLPLPPLLILDVFLPEMNAVELFTKLEGSEGTQLRSVSCQFIVNHSTQISDDEFVAKVTQLRQEGMDLNIWEGPQYLIPNLWGIAHRSSHSVPRLRLLQTFIEHRKIGYTNRLDSA